MTTQERTVASLARRLDKVKPGWEQLVNTEALDLYSGYNCIAGQVFKDEAALGGEWSNGYGYAVLDPSGPLYHLTEAQGIAVSWNPGYRQPWIDLIDQRRAAATS